MQPSVIDMALTVINASTAPDKVAAANALAKAQALGKLGFGKTVHVALPETPGRPAKPELVPPSEVPRRRLGSEQGRAALLHAVAHIEFNAINLAADMLARFSLDPRIEDDKRKEFVSDWVSVCADEARHFGMICERLSELGCAYGDLPAHNGLWEAAISTAHDLSARLVIAPMVLEARGLDVTPGMIERLKRANDMQSASVLQIIYDDEIGHVEAGSRWFHYLCAREGKAPHTEFAHMVKTYFSSGLKPPFNHDARRRAALPKHYYAPSA